MIRRVLASVLLSALMIYGVVRLADLYEQALPKRVTAIEIFHDRITYRTGTYATPTLLAIGLKAAHDPPQQIVLHDCSRMGDFKTVLTLVRAEGYASFDVKLPENC